MEPRPLESVMRTLSTSGLAKEVAKQIPVRPASSRSSFFAKKPNKFRNRSYAQNVGSAKTGQLRGSIAPSASAVTVSAKVANGTGNLTQTLLHMSQYDYSNAVSTLKQSIGTTYHARTMHNPRSRNFSRGFLGVMYTDTSLDSATREKAKEAAAQQQHAKGGYCVVHSFTSQSKNDGMSWPYRKILLILLQHLSACKEAKMGPFTKRKSGRRRAPKKAPERAAKTTSCAPSPQESRRKGKKGQGSVLEGAC